MTATRYTLTVAPTTVMAITPAARKPHYDPLKYITALARLCSSLGMLTISNELGVKSLPHSTWAGVSTACAIEARPRR